MPNHCIDKRRKPYKRAEAEARNVEWRSLSAEQQLRSLDLRPGKSARQRKRLAAKIALDNSASPPV